MKELVSVEPMRPFMSRIDILVTVEPRNDPEHLLPAK